MSSSRIVLSFFILDTSNVFLPLLQVLDLQGATNLITTAIMDPVAIALLLLVTASAWASPTNENALPFPSLSLLESALRTTSTRDFDGRDSAYQATVLWEQQRLRYKSKNQRTPYLACAKYSDGHEAADRLKNFLSPEAVRFTSNTRETGACFIVAASYEQEDFISGYPEQFSLTSIGPIPSALKLAPGLLDHNGNGNSTGRLVTSHGVRMSMANVEGLSVALAPGTLRMHDPEAYSFARSLLEDLTSELLDLHAGNVWSDPAMKGAEHHVTEGGARRAQEWTRAADVVHELSEAVGTSPSDICSWDSASLYQAGDDVMVVSGIIVNLFFMFGKWSVQTHFSNVINTSKNTRNTHFKIIFSQDHNNTR